MNGHSFLSELSWLLQRSSFWQFPAKLSRLKCPPPFFFLIANWNSECFTPASLDLQLLLLNPCPEEENSVGFLTFNNPLQSNKNNATLKLSQPPTISLEVLCKVPLNSSANLQEGNTVKLTEGVGSSLMSSQLPGAKRGSLTSSAPPPAPWLWFPFWLWPALLLQALPSALLAPQTAGPPWQSNHSSQRSKHFLKVWKGQ